MYVPLVDGEDRLGVLSALVDDASAALVEDVQLLASAAAGLIVSKRHYTDGYEFARRLEPMDLAAEFRWALLPPLTLWSPRVRIAGMLEPAYEIAGDAFDYAVNGDVAHVAMFDAVGHGMRACRIANLAIRDVPERVAGEVPTSPRPPKRSTRSSSTSSARAGS